MSSVLPAGFPGRPISDNLLRAIRHEARDIMDNQHREIKGYRELNRDEIALMNSIKTRAAEIGEMIAILRSIPEVDPRWISIGETHLQQGFMALTRAVAKPEFF